MPDTGAIPTLPDWYPGWARELAGRYFAGSACQFVLHGNVHDLVRAPAGFGNLAEFLATQVFGSWDIVLHYDLARGPRALAGRDAKRLQAMVQHLSSRLGEPGTWPREPEAFLAALDRFIERELLEEDPARRRSLAVILDYAQYLAPAGDLATLGRGASTNLVRLLGWAQHPYIKRVNMAFCLIADRLAEVNDRLVQSQHVVTVELPLPDVSERRQFIESTGKSQNAAELAARSNGLSLLNLNTILAQGTHGDAFRSFKKTLIERQCRGLLEFVEPKHTLDLVVGQQAAKDRLKEDAKLLTEGRLEAAPMGYLLCGPVGTGKTFLAECYAGSVGIPCVKLRNFRSKYVGETEANLEQVLTVLRAIGPVVVLIDEADAALGSREAEGDSGTSSRVFGMIASQMGDTRYRGRIVWMLLTARPDLLPIDLKRQGRAEIHIPLFYPQDEAEAQEMFRVMAKKNKAPLAADAVPAVWGQRLLSGSDIESILIGAWRRVLSSGRSEINAADLAQALADFIPSGQGLEKEFQELAAVLECTEQNFLPPDWRARLAELDGRAKLQERFAALRLLLKA